jgi:LPXTG-motif cell wall-anchored protein
MKKKLFAAAALVGVALLATAPASALTKNDAGSIICQIPSDYDAYDAQQFGADGSTGAPFSGGVDTGFNEPYAFTAVDNNTNTLYLLSSGFLYATDLVNEGDATQIGVTDALGSYFSPVGLAVDDITGTVYASNFVSLAHEYHIFTFNASSGVFEEHLTLDSADLTDGGNMSFYAGHIYVYDKATGKIVVFDATSGAQTGLIEAAPDNYSGYNAALHVTADGRIFFYSETSVGTDYGINYYSLATSTWGSNIDAVDMDNEGWGGSFSFCTWWGPAEVAAPDLPDTGANSGILASLLGGGAVLLALGVALVVIRRRSLV